MFKVTCSKCKGSGSIQCFTHVDGGVCYDCKGTGFHMRKTNPVTLNEYHVTAIIREGFVNSGGRGGVFIKARSEKDALKKARLSGDAYVLESMEAMTV